jgi:hypothetical protein
MSTWHDTMPSVTARTYFGGDHTHGAIELASPGRRVLERSRGSMGALLGKEADPGVEAGAEPRGDLGAILGREVGPKTGMSIGPRDNIEVRLNREASTLVFCCSH